MTRDLETLWSIILEKVENQANPSIYLAILGSDFTEEEGEAVFKDGLDDDTDYNNTLEFINSRIKAHRKS